MRCATVQSIPRRSAHLVQLSESKYPQEVQRYDRNTSNICQTSKLNDELVKTSDLFTTTPPFSNLLFALSAVFRRYLMFLCDLRGPVADSEVHLMRHACAHQVTSSVMLKSV